MKINKLLRERRLQLGISSAVAASKSGLPVSAYDDLEQHADEFESAIPLEIARRVCGVLNLPMVDLLAARSGKTQKQVKVQSRSALLREALRKEGISVHQLAELLGFEDIAIIEMGRDDDFLESWPIQLISELATLLKVDLSLLLQLDVKLSTDLAQ